MNGWKLTAKQWEALDELRFSTTDKALFHNATIIRNLFAAILALIARLAISPPTVAGRATSADQMANSTAGH